MTFLYDLAYLIFGIIYLPIFLIKGRQAESFRELFLQRLSLYPGSWKRKHLGNKVIWVHAVSVGEVGAAGGLIDRLLESMPGYKIVLTTVTPTGQRMAKKYEGRRVAVSYCPFDISFMVSNFLAAVEPECILLVETEVWPNLISQARIKKIPVGIVNGRLSARSVRGYRRFGLVFKSIFEKLDFVIVQTELDARRFSEAGTPEDRIQIAGNLKLDHPRFHAGAQNKNQASFDGWPMDQDCQVIIAGSTHPGEEELIAGALKQVREKLPKVQMILAPRHIERAPGVKKRVQALGLTSVLTSEPGTDAADVLVLDCLGVLKDLYAMADVVFVGGSLVRHGGQNPIEPAVYSRAIVHGPHVFNFISIYERLDEEGGAICVRDTEELVFAFQRLLSSAKERETVGRKAFLSLASLGGATQRHVDVILDFMGIEKELERVNHG